VDATEYRPKWPNKWPKRRLEVAKNVMISIKTTINIRKHEVLEAARDAALKAKTFEEVAEEYLSEVLERRLAADKMKAATLNNWKTRLRRHAYPVIGKRRMEEIATSSRAIIDVLFQSHTFRGKQGRYVDVSPWPAENLRGYIADIIDYAMQMEYCPRSGFNPADRENLDKSIPELEKPPAKEMDYHEIPPFVAKVREYQRTTWNGGSERAKTSGVVATLLIMLTAARIGVTVAARWEDIDLDKAIWSIPKGDQKRTRGEAQKQMSVYKVPLSPEAVELLENHPREGQYVFPGLKTGGHISREPVVTLMDKCGLDRHTPHDFRKFFSTWANDYTWGDRQHFKHELIEHCLAHLVGSEVSRIYNTATQIDLRRQVYNAWAKFSYAPRPVLAAA
jgi:integrase